MSSECDRHRGIRDTVVRCAHIGNRFVVHFTTPASHYVCIDYVEDLPDDGLVVESSDWYEPSPDIIASTWDDKVSRMRADVPPDPERAYVVDDYFRVAYLEWAYESLPD